MTILTPHFSLEEFTFSETAARRGIDNTVPPGLMSNAKSTGELLERIRDYLTSQSATDVPLRITSGFRCLALNRAIGSMDSSDHVQAMAADVQAPRFGTPYQIARALVPVIDKLRIGQLILEYGSWIHVGTAPPEKPVNRIITYSHQWKGARVGIVQA